MSINKVILLGNLGKEPEIKQFENGKIASFTLATTKKGYTTKSGISIPDKTEWHNIVVFAGLAEVAEKYLHKGSKVYVEGEIRYRVFESQNGEKKYLTDIYCDTLEMCDKAQTTAQPSNAPVAQPQTAYNAPQAQVTQPISSDNFGDGLPF